MAMWSERGPKRVDACDVVVVGAGLVGAAVTAHLAHHGFDVAVLEAQRVAGGATGRSAGMVLTGLPGHYNWAVSVYGRQKAREIWALTVEGRERVIETAGRLGVEVEHTGSLELAVEDIEAGALEASAELLQEDGFDVHFDPGDPLGRGFHAALHQPADVTVDAAALTRALLDASGVTVHERTEVYKLEPERDGVRVWARGRTVLCSAVVLAINGYAPLLDPYFADRVAPIRSLILATEPLGEVVLEQPCCADYGYEYCRQLPDRRLLLGCWRRPRAANAEVSEEADLDDVVQDGLALFAAHYFPDVETHAADRWSGVMGFTPDGLPLVGTLPSLPQAYFAVGLGGRGLAWAFVVAERLVELMLRDAEPGILAADRLA
ncbi:MAG: FAD-binding oxidoreductase [Chloroflexi bacterium]|nr:FAD-binding oxidoreductase [Chloroflexota bacterium]